MSKALLRNILALSAMIISASSSTAIADTVKSGDLYFDCDEGSATATVARNSAYQSLSAIDIPSSVTANGKSYTVTKIAQQAFQECQALKKVTMQPGVEVIEKWAFYGCASLENVDFPATLTTLMSSSFSGCQKLNSVVLPDNLTSIADYAFGSCAAMKSAMLPKNMKSLGGYAFSGCSSLERVIFPSQLESIGDNAFYGCGLLSATLPESLTSLGTGAFSQCSKLTKIDFPDALKSIGDQAFFKCVSLDNIVFPANLQTIGMGSFYECESLSQIAFPESVTSIGANAFYGCKGLTSVSIPEKVTQLSNGIFYNCTGLTEVNLHQGITSIGSSAFFNCSSLKSIELPVAITELSASLFSYCGLTSIDIPANVTSIMNNVFYGCKNLVELDISAKVTSIGNAFALGCTQLQNINVAEGNHVYRDIDGVLFTKDGATLIAYPCGRKGSYSVPENTTHVADYAFNSCTAVTDIDFPATLKSIGLSTFYGCSGLKNIFLPESVDSVGKMAFFMARSIENVTLPNHQTFIGNNAFSANSLNSFIVPEGFTSLGIDSDETFSVMSSCAPLTFISLPSSLRQLCALGSGCKNMKGIYCFATEAPELVGEYAVDIQSTVYVPKGMADAYREKWGALYPNMTFSDMLPVGATVVPVDAHSAVLEWEAFADGSYTATPTTYTATLFRTAHGGDSTQEQSTFEVAPATSTTKLRHIFTGLSEGAYSYRLEGFASSGQLTLTREGSFDFSPASVVDAKAAPVLLSKTYYDLDGHRLDSPANGSVVVEVATFDNGAQTSRKIIF